MIEVRCFSRSGNTQAIAEAIAKAVGAEAKGVDEPLTQHTDILFLGGALYAGGIAGKLKKFIKKLSPDEVGMVIPFSTTADPNGAYAKIKKSLDKYGLPVSQKEFHCLGKDAKGQEAQERAATFAREVIK